MPIRRTRKDKISARHQYLVSWTPEAKKNRFEANVKRQLKKPLSTSSTNIKKSKLAINTDKNDALASVNKDLAKSLIFASLILASEVMIYLFWLR